MTDSAVRQPGHPARPRRRSGLTLIELLVAVAVIGILLATLLPSLSAARASAQRVTCLSNLRQLATAWQLYLEDHDGHFLQGGNTNFNYGGRQGGIAAFQKPKPLNPYVGYADTVFEGAELFRCPGDIGGVGAARTYFKYYGTSYTTNFMLVGQKQMLVLPGDACTELFHKVNERLRGFRQADVANEHRLILMGDLGWVHAWLPDDPQRMEWHGEPCSHSVAFVDGHAEFLRICKGLHVTPDYTVIPFAELQQLALTCQEELDCENPLPEE